MNPPKAIDAGVQSQEHQLCVSASAVVTSDIGVANYVAEKLGRKRDVGGEEQMGLKGPELGGGDQ